MKHDTDNETQSEAGDSDKTIVINHNHEHDVVLITMPIPNTKKKLTISFGPEEFQDLIEELFDHATCLGWGTFGVGLPIDPNEPNLPSPSDN
jgi:hypothetical protein